MKSKFLQAESAVESPVFNSRLVCFHSWDPAEDSLSPHEQNFMWDFGLPEKYTKRHWNSGKDSNALVPQNPGHITNVFLIHLAVSAARELVPRRSNLLVHWRNNPFNLCVSKTFKPRPKTSEVGLLVRVQKLRSTRMCCQTQEMGLKIAKHVALNLPLFISRTLS